MDGWKFILYPALLVALLAMARALIAWRRREHQFQDALRLWRATPADRHVDEMKRLTTLPEAPAAARFLLGCALLRQSRTAEAARAFGTAHHADWRLQNAALLTFAALKAREGADGDIIEQIIHTWREMKRPRINITRQDQDLMECLAATTRDPPRLSPLGRLIWLVIGPSHQSRLELMLDSQVPLAQDLRAAATA